MQQLYFKFVRKLAGEYLWEDMASRGVRFGDNSRDYHKKIKFMVEAESTRIEGRKVDLKSLK